MIITFAETVVSQCETIKKCCGDSRRRRTRANKKKRAEETTKSRLAKLLDWMYIYIYIYIYVYTYIYIYIYMYMCFLRLRESPQCFWVTSRGKMTVSANLRNLSLQRFHKHRAEQIQSPCSRNSPRRTRSCSSRSS